MCNYPNEKYKFLRLSVISYYCKLHNIEEGKIPFNFKIQDLLEFTELCYLSYCKERGYKL